MRSSGRTIVSRTIDRIASDRRSLRGLFVGLSVVALMSLPDGLFVVVVILSFPEECPCTVAAAEAAACQLECTVRAEPLAADQAPFEVRFRFGIPAADTSAILFCHAVESEIFSA
jgi:hypothetical protein